MADAAKPDKRLSLPIILAVAATAVMTAVLALVGRIWWCKLGDAPPSM
jgi:hypothetical protein